MKPNNFINENSIEISNASAPVVASNEQQTAGVIQDWIISKIAEAAQVEKSDIDIHLPFSSYGLESLVLFTLTGDLASWLEYDLPATLFWEYPTIESLSRHLAEALAE